MASLATSLGAMVADERLGVGLGQPVSLLAALEPSRNHRPLCPRFGFESTDRQRRLVSNANAFSLPRLLSLCP
jgi:hypothetical protein